MAEGIKERLTEYARKALGMGQNKFEQDCGISRGTIAAIGKGISTVTLQKILAKHPDLNVEWLLTGQGDMIKNSNTDAEEYQYDAKNPISGSLKDVVVQVPTSEEKRENRGGLDGNAGELEYLRRICRQQKALIDRQKEMIDDLTKIINDYDR